MQGHEPILSVLCNKAKGPASVSEIKQKGIQLHANALESNHSK